MADNTELNVGSGGDTIATDDIGGVKHQRVKIQYGADGSATDVSDSNPLPIDDAGGSITVDGTVTANLSATDNAVLDNIQTSVDTLAAAVSTEFQVDVVGSLPAGTNAIGKLAANSGVDIGDVDVTSIIPGTGATNLGKAIDTAAGSTDTGIAALAIRDDSLTTLTPVDGDYVPLRVSSTGALHVTGSAGSTQYVEDTAHGSGDTGTMILAVRTDTRAALAGTTGDYTPLQTNSNGDLRVEVSSYADAKTDDAAYTVGTDAVAIIGGVQTSDAVDAGDGGAFGMTTGRALYVSIENDSVGIGGGTQYTEDAAAAANPVGNATILVRDDSLGGSLTTADGDNVAWRGNNKGEAYVKDTDAAALLTTIDADTSSLAGTVSGSEVQVDVVAALPTGTNSIGNVGVITRTTGGASFYLNQDTNAVASVKASAGTLYSICCFNTHTAAVYLNLYNVASGSVTLGSTTPSMQFVVPTQSASANGAGFVINFGPQGIAFGTAITVACATTYNGSGDPGANLVITNITYA